MFFFLSPTLPIQGIRLSVVGWQHERQKIIEDQYKIPTSAQIESCGGNSLPVSIQPLSHMSRVICIPDLTPFILEEVHASNIYLMKVSCLQKYNAGNATLN